MDGSCVTQIFPSTKTQCASTHHSRKYTHRHKHNLHTYTHTHTHTHTHTRTHTHTHTHTHTRVRAHTHIMVHLDLWQCLLKKGSFELGFEVRGGGEIPQVGRQRVPDSWALKLKEQSPTDLRLRLGIFKSFSFDDRRVRKI